jgi:hypothetical protein
MSILTENQYNLGMDKYKLLSSTSGVGAVVASKTGNFILISSIDKWPFINKAYDIIKNERERNMATLLEESSKRLNNELGLNIIGDDRFIGFLKVSESLSNLVLLLSVPEINLNDFFNNPEWRNHPIKQKIVDAVASNYLVQSTHFPKWFVGKNGKLQTIDKWREDWSSLVNQNQNVNTNHFAPPRDANSPKQENLRRKTDSDGNYETMDIYNELSQNNLALICEHGHLMDIPWSKYINVINAGNIPVDLDEVHDCCGHPSLKWTESTNKSEGFENVFVECRNCGKKKNLAGINSFECLCKGHKPWEIHVTGGFRDKKSIPFEICSHEGKRGVMEVSLVTANRMYYATGKNSLFIPLQLKPVGFENQDLLRVLTYLNSIFKEELKVDGNFKFDTWVNDCTNTRFLRQSGVDQTFFTNEITISVKEKVTKFILEDFLNSAKSVFDLKTKNIEDKAVWFQENFNESFLYEDVGLNKNFVNCNFYIIKEHFNTILFEDNNRVNVEYDEENYRLYEYNCFSENQKVDKSGLRFDTVQLSANLSQYFTSIKQVSELKVTQVQLSFNRNKPRIAYQDNNGNLKYSSNSKRIFEGEDENQFVLPAVQNYGEGIFFQFNEKSINAISSNERIQNILSKNHQPQDQGFGTWEILRKSGQKYFIVHTFSHLIMRELEFACGYPTASLKERLYISSEGNEFMAGILIYTTDGSEGSMGGLVSQASEHNVENLIRNALLRGVDCSSDPLCWESDGQGLFDFNLAACFSCSLVSETACEAMNLGLDRRVLVDEEFGYFKELVNE